jgi:hypothetical protein
MATARTSDWLGGLYAVVTGEYLLVARPNGGEVILARSLITTFFVYLLALGAHSYSAKGAALAFDPNALRRELHETLPWAGAIFGAVYIALYTRYSNQWAYLGNLYNQIMAAKAAGNTNINALERWKVGFIADAYTLHLDRKPLFAGVIQTMLREHPGVLAELANCLTDREKVKVAERFQVVWPPASSP